ncbi:MAG: hypothetical protein PUG67_09195 [Peptoniphilaceae bacterium]|nr:hypothetical protein [Peptoniphilaceae bacterium]MDY6018502.1 hypothetical protein [Anaerococcus sp.]
MISVLIILLFNILFGFLLCFYGKTIVGWLFSLLIILISGAYFYSKYGFSQKNLLTFIVFAILVLLAFNVFVKLGLFLIGGLVGMFLGLILVSYLSIAYSKYFKAIILIVGLVFAIITSVSQKKILAFLTALLGANILSRSLLYLALNIQNLNFLSKSFLSLDLKKFVGDLYKGESQAAFIGVLIFTVIGFLFQNRKNLK